MKIENDSNLSVDFIREVVRFCKPHDVSKFDLIMKEKKGYYSGTAFKNGSNCNSYSNSLVILRIDSDETRYPYRNSKSRDAGYLPYLLLSSEEAFVHITAHELRHLWQYRHPKGWRVWGAKSGASERDADAYAIRKVREWRKNRRCKNET